VRRVIDLTIGYSEDMIVASESERPRIEKISDYQPLNWYRMHNITYLYYHIGTHNAQAMIDSLVPEHVKAGHKIYQIDGDGKFMDRFKSRGVHITEPPPELMTEMRKIAQEVVWWKWANDQEKRELPGNKVLETNLALIEKNAAANPFK
jgi:hypothetical protein